MVKLLAPAQLENLEDQETLWIREVPAAENRWVSQMQVEDPRAEVQTTIQGQVESPQVLDGACACAETEGRVDQKQAYWQMCRKQYGAACSPGPLPMVYYSTLNLRGSPVEARVEAAARAVVQAFRERCDPAAFPHTDIV